VEIEILLVDDTTFDLTSGAPEILKEPNGNPKVKPELLESIIEINTDICNDTSEVHADLQGKLNQVLPVVTAHNMRLISTGTHPFARWSKAHVTRNKRYQGFVQGMQFSVSRLPDC